MGKGQEMARKRREEKRWNTTERGMKGRDRIGR